MKQLLYFTFLTLLVLSISCATDKADEVIPGDTSKDTTMTDSMDIDTTNKDTTDTGTPLISFSGKVLPIFKTNCTDKNCHVGPGGWPFELLTHENISKNLDRILPAVKWEGTINMPLGGDQISLEDIMTIETWKDEGSNNN